METQKTLLIEEEMIKKKYQDIKMWMSRNGLPKDMKKEITECINKNKVVEKDLDVDVDINFLFSVTPPALRSSFKVHLCIDTLKKVSIYVPQTTIFLQISRYMRLAASIHMKNHMFLLMLTKRHMYLGTHTIQYV